MKALNALRTRLFLAIGLVVVLSIGLMLFVGTKLTSREVDRTTLHDLSRQADILAAQQRSQLLRHHDGDVEIIGRQHLGPALRASRRSHSSG